MKTRLKNLFLLAIILLTPNFVQAESSCSYSEQAEINDIVANVKASYEVVEIYGGKAYDVDNPNPDGTFPEVDYYLKAFNINIMNITEDIYVKVSNNLNHEVKTFRYSNTQNGTAYFQTNEVESLVTYTIKVYSNKYSCAGEMFREFALMTPQYNNYSERPACKLNPDFYYCQEFLPSENISFSEFQTKIKEYQEEKQKKEEEEKQNENKKFVDKLKDFYENNKLIIYSSGIIIVVAGVATTVILVKKKRSRVL